MIDDLDLEKLHKTPRIGYYFRYTLHRSNFHELKIGNHIYGHFTAKPLYGRLTAQGRVDKSAGFNGDVAIIFVPSAVKTLDDVELFVAHTTPASIQLPGGKRNWKVINETAAKFITTQLTEK